MLDLCPSSVLAFSAAVKEASSSLIDCPRRVNEAGMATNEEC